jgi:hypothetical protein
LEASLNDLEKACNTFSLTTVGSVADAWSEKKAAAAMMNNFFIVTIFCFDCDG